MDRLFGKELSNLLNPSLTSYPQNYSRLHSKSGRGISKNNHSKHFYPKVNKTSGSQNTSLRIQKINLYAEEKQNIENLKNAQMIPEYFEECIQYMLGQQQKEGYMGNYMLNQPAITDKMRGILIEWIADLHYKFKMFPETLYKMVMIIDKFLSKKEATKQNLQLIGTAAFFIAAKYQETYQVPQLNDLVHFSANAFTKNEIIEMEADILQTINFDLVMDTAYTFFEPLAKISVMDQKNFHLAQYVLELALLDSRFLAYKPSIMASSAIYLINKVRKINEAWPDLLMTATRYEQKELKSCARQLCYLLERADELPNTKSLKKKFSSSEFHEVTRVKLERRGHKN